MNTLNKKPAHHRWTALCTTLVALAVFTAASGFTRLSANGEEHRTTTFAGVKANTGYAIYKTEDGKRTLTLSDDFKVPDTPAPHWQVVDTEGNVYLLQRLVVKGDKYNQTIEVPGYVSNIAKVQIWCAWAEALLGEASFDKPVS